MNTSDPAFTAGDFLRLTDRTGLTGSWRWDFVTNQQFWSSGLYGILGLTPDRVSPDYGLLLDLVHPDDRLGLATIAEIVKASILEAHTFRIIRPDGTLRTLTTRGRVRVAPDGRPLSAAGVMIDVSDQEMLARAHRSEARRRRALFEVARIFTTAFRTFPVRDFSAECLALTGLSNDELAADFTRAAVPEERALWRDRAVPLFLAGKPFSLTPKLILAGGDRARFTYVTVPVRDGRGVIRSWTTMAYPAASRLALPVDDVRAGLEQAVEGHHMRAARGLLDWTLKDLAQASGLSLSTVRRLEDNSEGPTARSRPAVLAALRTAGIRFSLLDGSTIAVSLTA
ncbi:hypothetical protein OPKNFCMD_3015 [Methylobacterium crusticola]|uniref:histidine kinase n=1 Tax=Methylobacterium crusticola TaxID=1697972 RepID=A0ABQ4QXZ7_9HYPH|nr:PAS domain-containing protein [Methylobacterium crusticola]GJD50277.1 hypothetical protein OPKNFCMD_3015 [Methylobacterium crusticola]